MNGDTAGSNEGASKEMVEVNLPFETMRQLQDELAPTLSNDGLFLPSENPPVEDTVVRFRITLPEDFVLIEGTGVVIWRREPGAGGGPPGMAVRYASLSSEAQETIDAIIDAHLASGGNLYSLESKEEPVPSIPTDALDHDSLDSRPDPAAAREATARQLEQARLTIRERPDGTTELEPSQPQQEPIASLEDDYLSSVEAQVEGAVASIRTTGDEPAPSVEEPEIEAIVLGDGQQPPSEPTPAPAEEPIPDKTEPSAEIAPDHPETDGVVEPETDTATEGGPPRQAAASEAEEGAETEVIESVIPAFLERWKQEVGSGGEGEGGESPPPPEPGHPIQESDEELFEAPPIEIEEPAEDVPAAEQDTQPATAEEESDAQPRPVDEPAAIPGPETEPGEAPPQQFEVSVVDSGSDTDETPVREPTLEDSAVTLAPSERPSSSRLRWRWALPALLVPLVAVGAYFGLDWYRNRAASQPQAETVETVEVVNETAAEAASEPALEEPSGIESEPPSEGEETSEIESQPVAEAPPEVEAPPEAVPTVPASTIDSIVWRQEVGSTSVVIRGNGVIDEESVSLFPMRDPPRILVRIRKIQDKYQQFEIPVATAEIDRIRIGHHPELTPPALYVVLDLADPLVGVADIAVEGDIVRVSVAVQ
jgi:uncharacterized protein (TIGR02266 family)